MVFRRETATNEADMPHEFAARSGESLTCSVCGASSEDVKHVSWLKFEEARERANSWDAVRYQREQGS